MTKGAHQITVTCPTEDQLGIVAKLRSSVGMEHMGALEVTVSGAETKIVFATDQVENVLDQLAEPIVAGASVHVASTVHWRG